MLGKSKGHSDADISAESKGVDESTLNTVHTVAGDAGISAAPRGDDEPPLDNVTDDVAGVSSLDASQEEEKGSVGGLAEEGNDEVEAISSSDSEVSPSYAASGVAGYEGDDDRGVSTPAGDAGISAAPRGDDEPPLDNVTDDVAGVSSLDASQEEERNREDVVHSGGEEADHAEVQVVTSSPAPVISASGVEGVAELDSDVDDDAAASGAGRAGEAVEVDPVHADGHSWFSNLFDIRHVNVNTAAIVLVVGILFTYLEESGHTNWYGE